MTQTQPRPAGSAGSDQPDIRRMRAQIERTRNELAETVAALAAKTDIQGRTRAKAARVAQQTTQAAAQRIHDVRQTVGEAVHTATHGAADAAHTAADATTHLVTRAQTAPERMRERSRATSGRVTARVTVTERRRLVPVVVAGVVTGAVATWLGWRRRRS